MRISATGVLLSPVEDAWRLVGEPFHLPDWWPRYTATVAVEGRWSRITFEGLRPVPREAVSRLRALCQTAADL